MNHAPDPWQELARTWRTGNVPVTAADIETLRRNQQRRLRIARGAEVACSALGIVAALWLGLASRFFWVGMVTVVFSVASIHFALRGRRMPVPPGSADLLQSLNDSLAYLDWLAGQLRTGRVLGYVALFAVVMAASAQLMRFASAAPLELLATVVAGVAVSATLGWNLFQAWQVWKRVRRLQSFKARLMAADVVEQQEDGDPPVQTH